MDRIERLKEFFAEDPKDSFVRFALASEYAKLGIFEEAIQTFEGLLKDDPDYVGTYYHLGKLYERVGKPARAQEVYRRGIEAATRVSDLHARAELQSALLESEGLGFD
jgi:tetratricopeptide (TPR) repeat protein